LGGGGRLTFKNFPTSKKARPPKKKTINKKKPADLWVVPHIIHFAPQIVATLEKKSDKEKKMSASSTNPSAFPQVKGLLYGFKGLVATVLQSQHLK
jgi:hypothetical protein